MCAICLLHDEMGEGVVSVTSILPSLVSRRIVAADGDGMAVCVVLVAARERQWTFRMTSHPRWQASMHMDRRTSRGMPSTVAAGTSLLLLSVIVEFG